ncbi:unnamed protein product, partial [Effrenium voratum]
AKTSLASQHKVGVRFKKPKMLFVLEKNWDTKVHGKFDVSKVVEQMAFRKLERGIYVQAGQQGVFEVEHYDDMGVMEETEEHSKDEQGPLAAVGLQNKRKAVHSMVHEAAAERAAKSTKPAAPMEFDAILSVLQSTGHLSSSAGAASSSSKADDPAAKAGAAPAGSESLDSTDSEEDNPAARLSAAVKGKAAGKPAPKKAAAKPAPAPSGKQARLDKPAVPAKKEHKAGAEGASPPDSSEAAPELPVGTLSLDGSLLTTLRSQTKRVDDSANKAETVLPSGSLGKGAWLKAVAALAAHHAMCRAWDKVVSLYNEEQEQVSKLLGHCSREDVSQMAVVQVEARVTSLLRAVPVADLSGGQLSDPCEQVLAFCSALEQASAQEGTLLEESLSTRAGHLKAMVELQDFVAVRSAVDWACSRQQPRKTRLLRGAAAKTRPVITDFQEGEAEEGSQGGIGHFFTHRITGAALVDRALAFLEGSEHETRREKALQLLQAQVSELADLKSQPAPVMNKVEDALDALCATWTEVAESFEETGPKKRGKAHKQLFNVLGELLARDLRFTFTSATEAVQEALASAGWVGKSSPRDEQDSSNQRASEFLLALDQQCRAAIFAEIEPAEVTVDNLHDWTSDFPKDLLSFQEGAGDLEVGQFLKKLQAEAGRLLTERVLETYTAIGLLVDECVKGHCEKAAAKAKELQPTVSARCPLRKLLDSFFKVLGRWEITKEKTPDVHEAQEMLQLLCACQALIADHAKNREDPDGKLAATKLLTQSCSGWLSVSRERLQATLQGLYVAQTKKVSEATLHGKALLSTVPAVAQESAYRNSLAKTVANFAGHAQKLKKLAHDLQASVKALVKSSSLGCPEDAKKSGFTMTDEHFKDGLAIAGILSLHVTFFASLTLLRSPGQGGQSDKAKKTAKQLEGVLSTLLEQDLPACPEVVALPDEAVLKLLKEMEAAVSRSLGSCSVDVSDLWGKLLKKRGMTDKPMSFEQPSAKAEGTGRGVGPADAKAAVKAADKAADKATGKDADKTADKATGKAADKAADKLAGKAADKTADKATGKAAGKAADKPAGKAADKTANKPTGEAADKATGKAGGAAEQPATSSAEQRAKEATAKAKAPAKPEPAGAKSQGLPAQDAESSASDTPSTKELLGMFVEEEDPSKEKRPKRKDGKENLEASELLAKFKSGKKWGAFVKMVMGTKQGEKADASSGSKRPQAKAKVKVCSPKKRPAKAKAKAKAKAEPAPKTVAKAAAPSAVAGESASGHECSGGEVR